MRLGACKLVKQTGQTAHFARVSVEVTLADTDEFVITCPNRSIGAWDNAVMTGVSRAIGELRELGLLPDPVRVVVTEFVGLVTDTTDHDADRAAFVAVLSAFPELVTASISYSEQADGWIVSWKRCEA